MNIKFRFKNRIKNRTGNKIKNKIAVILAIFFIISLVIFISVIGRPANSAGLFEVKPGQSLSQIGTNLVDQKFLNNKYPFYFYVLLTGKENNLKAGYYLFSVKDNFITIARKLIYGDNYKIKITFPEGSSLKDIEKKLNESGFVFKTGIGDFSIKDFKEDFNFLSDAPDKATLEGYLFPDTYFFNPNMTEQEIVKVFLENFDKKFTDDMRTEAKKQNKKIFNIVTMASVIEKEVITQEDKKLVSGIFWERIRIGQPLQSCATTAYILGVNKKQYSYEDTRVPSPYNTYLNRGLPVGPISNPGIESIISSLYPKISDYLYYLSTPEGKTVFSKTYEEHNIAKAKYLQ